MPDHSNSFPSFSSSKRDFSLLFVIVWVVIAMHLLLLAIGTYWNPSPPSPKVRSKVVVQTIQLKPFQSATIQNPPPIPAPLPISAPVPAVQSLPLEQPKNDPQPVTSPLKEENPPPANITVQKEETPPIPENPIKKAEAAASTSTKDTALIPTPIVSVPPTPAPPPTPKTEAKPQQKDPSPKPSLQETPKTNAKKSAPIKKTIEPAKKSTKSEPVKPKETDEAEKKRQKEKAEAEKKRKQERTEAEKKQQQAIAEAERKRQQEIAAAQQAARQKEQALLAKAKETLAKMGETRDKISSSSSLVSLEATALPKELGSLQVDALPVGEVENGGDWGSKETSYRDEVAYRLKSALKLPDYGAVKIELTLDRTGKFVKVKIVNSESSKNKAYVESNIPKMIFPSFGLRFQGKSQSTFEITLQNDS